MLCLPLKGMAQDVEMLSDSLVYNVTMYQDLHKKYRNKKGQLQQDVIGIIKEQRPDVASKVNLNAKFDALGLDSVDVAALAKTVSNSVKASISEDDVASLSTVNDLFEAVRSEGDTIMLIMAYYPWREVLESRSVHRVGVYEDGIAILGDLIELTKDSIQREIYLNELMNVYDVWYENVDTINTRMDSPYSKTLILSEKVRKYDEMLPLLYHLKWNVGDDTINSKPIQENVHRAEVVRLYDYMREALYDQNEKEDLYYEIPYLFFRLSHSRLTYLNKLGKVRSYADQYTLDFDSVNTRFEYYKTMELGQALAGNVAYRQNEVAEMYEDASGAILVGTTKDWRKKEPEFRRQLYDKMDLWDLGMEKPDPKFLNRVITGLNTDSSEVYIEAMEIYVDLPATDEKILDNIKKYRKRLSDYYIRESRYTDAIAILRKILGDEKGNSNEMANAYYKIGYCQFEMKQYSQAQSNFRNATTSNKEYGDAYYLLALCYEQITFFKDVTLDKYKYLLCMDILNQAKECIARNVNGSMRKYNTVQNAKLDSRINYYMQVSPAESEAAILPADYRTPGKIIKFGKYGQTTVRFYRQ